MAPYPQDVPPEVRPESADGGNPPSSALQQQDGKYVACASFETRYPPIPELRAGDALPSDLAACRFVVVLGGGHGDTPGRSATNKLSSSALPRIVEGVRPACVLPNARMIVSGPPEGNNPSHAQVLASAAISLGIGADRIRLIETARDTEDESAAVRAIVGDAPIALVTSAWHMPRAAAIFRKAGVNILPCPADSAPPPTRTLGGRT